MAIFSGTNLIVSTGATPDEIVCATTCTLSINQEAVEASCKSTGKWIESVPGKAGWEITTDNLYDPILANNSFDTLVKSIIDDADGTADNALEMVFEIKDQVTPNIATYTGTAQLTDISLNGDDNAPATYSATFKGVGALVQNPAVA